MSGEDYTLQNLAQHLMNACRSTCLDAGAIIAFMIVLKEIVQAPGLHKGGRTISRQAVRGIIFDGKKLLLIHSAVNGDYKFPGGGVEQHETFEEALIREIQEECGLVVTNIVGALGCVVEYRCPVEDDYDVFKMTSRYYFCRVGSNSVEGCLDRYEADLGFRPVWVDIEAAIQTNEEIICTRPDRAPSWIQRDTFVLNYLMELDRVPSND
jgi:8-oxo-dGTP diphosphatase